MAPITALTAVELATLIRRRELTAAEATHACLDRIERHNPSLNAIVTLDAEAAMAAAEAADGHMARDGPRGPLHGVPITVKDSFETANLRTTCGLESLRHHVPDEDATVVARLRSAGAVVLGKTNLPPLTHDFQTSNPVFGRTNNPWDHARTPGGSSGGSAAAVSGRLSPLDVGSDITGSLRVPAHFCGVMTIKPTDHLVPATGHIPELPGQPRGTRHMQAIGPIARTAADLALVLRLIAGPDAASPDIPPWPVAPPTMPEPAQLRVACAFDFPGVPLAPGYGRLLETLARTLQDVGCKVSQTSLAGFDLELALETWGELYIAEAAASMSDDEAEQSLRSRPTDAPPFRGMVRMWPPTMGKYAETLSRRAALGAAWDGIAERADVVLCPVAPLAAFPHCPSREPLSLDGHRIPYFNLGAYCAPFSVTGHPVAVVPIGLTPDGLPAGVQIVGKRWRDAELLGVASLIEHAAGPLPAPPPWDED